MKPSSKVTISPRGESVRRFINPFSIVGHLWQHKELIRLLTWRDILGRYKGSFLGLGWSFIQPLLMLSVYTFVFSVIFNARWGTGTSEGKAEFALALFMGLITFNIFSELVNAAPLLILANVNYVKKVVFPLEILPVVKLFSVFVNALFSLVVLVAGLLIVNKGIDATILLLPIVWMPVMMFTLGIGYFLASLGVFIRDMGAIVGIVTTMLLFLSPIFYPASRVPEQFSFFCSLNPLAQFVDDSRMVALWGTIPDITTYCLSFLFTMIIWILGFLWFMKTKKAFADVI